MRPWLLLFCLLFLLPIYARRDSEEESDEEATKSPIPLPSRRAIEMVGVRFLDALIKKGQMEMAKGAFKTQLEVLEKVHPEQVDLYSLVNF